MFKKKTQTASHVAAQSLRSHQIGHKDSEAARASATAEKTPFISEDLPFSQRGCQRDLLQWAGSPLLSSVCIQLGCAPECQRWRPAGAHIIGPRGGQCVRRRLLSHAVVKVAEFVRSPCPHEEMPVIFEDPLLQSHSHWTCWTHLMVKRHTDVFRIWTVDNWEDRVSAFWETYNYKQTKNISARTWDRRQQFSWENLGDAWHCSMTGIKN